MTLPVVVVGAGPVGVTAAILLAERGVEVLVLERHAQVWPLPRAVHVDDEVHRVLQAAGVADGFARLSRPARGMRLLDARHRPFAEFSRDHPVGVHGWPQASTFDQPDLERLLRAQLDPACLRTGVEVLDVRGTGPVRVRLRELATGQVQELDAAAVLGCDGAGSLVRAAMGSRWQQLGPDAPWLVVDGRVDEPLAAWDGIHQVCDPRRAATFLRVGPDRYRWEFALRPGESAADLLPTLPALLAPWTAGAPVEILRAAGYVFRARVADPWRAGRVLLLGDAAHLTPPFVGQGLGLGLRDAANLAWKLARVLEGAAPEALLDSYQAERAPHARALVRLARTVGWAMNGGGGSARPGPAAAARRAALGLACRVPPIAHGVLDRGTPALRPGPLVHRRGLSGSLAPQPTVRIGTVAHRLDDLLGPGFAVLTRVPADDALQQVADRLGAPLLTTTDWAHDGGLAHWLGRATAVVVRPDRVVLAQTRAHRGVGADLAARVPWAVLTRAPGPDV